jgi:leader peptidase (prepilin peptidase)/N-methyltransferase
MGDGDIYLASLLGLLLGFPHIIISLYAAFLTGALVGIILILGGKKSFKAHIPFGPFLIWGYVVVLLWGDQIVRLWRMIW